MRIRKMKAAALKLVLCVLLMVAIALTAVNFSFVAFAGTNAKQGFEDNFDSNSGLDSAKWELKNNEGRHISQEALAGSLVMKNMPNASFVLTKNKLGTEGKGFSIDFDLLEFKGPGYIFFIKSVDGESVADAEMKDSIRQFTGDPRTVKGDYTPFDDYYQISTSTWLGNNSWGSVGLVSNMHYSFRFGADGSFKLMVKDLSKTDAVEIEAIKSKAGTFTDVNAGRMGFGFLEGAVDLLKIDNYVVKDADGLELFSDNFEKDGLDAEKWIASTAVMAGPARNLKMDNKKEASSATIVTKDAILNNTKEDVSKVMTFDLTLKELTSSAMVTLGAGESAVTKEEIGASVTFNFNEGNARGAGFRIHMKSETVADVTTNKVIATVVKGAGHTEKDLTAKEIVIGELKDFADKIPVTFTIKNEGAGGSIVMKTNARTLEAKNIDVNGKFGIAMNAATGAVVKANVDNLSVKNSFYTVSTAKDAYTNFDNGVDSSWYLQTRGTGGTDENPNPNGYGLSVKDGKLVFNMASDGSAFGTQEKYGNFELSFDLSDIVYEDIYNDDDEVIQVASSWIGISFNRQELDAQYHGGDGKGSNNLIIDSNPWGGGAGTALAGRAYYTREGILNAEEISYNFATPWSKQNQERGALTIKVKVVDGTMNMFMRYADEPLSKLDESVLSLNNVVSNGYVALCCTTNTSFKVDNYNIKNIDETGDQPFVLAETGFKVDTSAVKTNYANNEDFKVDGIKVYATFNNGTMVEVKTDAFTVDSSAFDKTKGGEYQIKVKYGAYSEATFKVTVAAAPEKAGCGGIVTASAAAVVLGALACVFVAIRRKKTA